MDVKHGQTQVIIVRMCISSDFYDYDSTLHSVFIINLLRIFNCTCASPIIMHRSYQS